ncbi:MAG: hypothetical protein FWD37_02170 [Methanomassiliicoccaceae archaeon]|nr:hypothetical protein [Methanomassiliicoccaceae archaeon]
MAEVRKEAVASTINTNVNVGIKDEGRQLTEQDIERIASWREYTSYGDDGFVNGMREDAPQWAKDEYKKYMSAKYNPDGSIKILI